MTELVFLDKETCGLVGPTILDQWAYDEDGEIHIADVWRRPVREALERWERWASMVAIGFNLGYDWYHVQKDYTVFRLQKDCSQPPNLREYLENERRASAEGPCIKPASALDLYLHAVQGPMQALMNRKDVRIRKLPTPMAELLCEELSKRIDLDDIFFKRVGNRRWTAYPHKDRGTGAEDPQFRDLVLKFGASAGLKPLMAHLFGVETIDFPVPDHLKPDDDKKEWYPFYDLVRWDRKLQGTVEFWATNARAREYARQDVDHLHRLYKHFGRPAHGDDNSVLACCVASGRWRGYTTTDVKPQN
jgi:hypothetical protein